MVSKQPSPQSKTSYDVTDKQCLNAIFVNSEKNKSDSTPKGPGVEPYDDRKMETAPEWLPVHTKTGMGKLSGVRL